ALRSGHQIAGTDPWIVGVDSAGLDLSIGSVTGSRVIERLPFSGFCRDSGDLLAEIAALGG
ncbi:hypothetical protein G6026_06820, partial [Dietzia sp. DQ11-38-2]|nr:hypothetical protein [Dietzia sp. DQ11-38-2]